MKKGLGYIGDDILPSYVGIISINHEIRIPFLNNQDDSWQLCELFFLSVAQMSFLSWLCPWKAPGSCASRADHLQYQPSTKVGFCFHGAGGRVREFFPPKMPVQNSGFRNI